MQSQLDSATVEEPCLALALDEWPLDMSDCTLKLLRDARTSAGEERYLYTPLADVIEEPCFKQSLCNSCISVLTYFYTSYTSNSIWDMVLICH